MLDKGVEFDERILVEQRQYPFTRATLAPLCLFGGRSSVLGIYLALNCGKALSGVEMLVPSHAFTSVAGASARAMRGATRFHPNVTLIGDMLPKLFPQDRAKLTECCAGKQRRFHIDQQIPIAARGFANGSETCRNGVRFLRRPIGAKSLNLGCDG